MARYGDLDVLKEHMEDFSKWCRDGRKQCVDFVLDCPLSDIPTADVVPLAEHEEKIAAMYAEIQRLLKLNADIDGQRITRAKQEAAREIFEEVETLVDEYIDGFYLTGEFIEILRKLKKKYTEVNENARRHS